MKTVNIKRYKVRLRGGAKVMRSISVRNDETEPLVLKDGGTVFLIEYDGHSYPATDKYDKETISSFVADGTLVEVIEESAKEEKS